MIATLSGSLLIRSQDRVVIDVGGVGYEVFLSTDSLSRLPETGDSVFLYIYTQVREDAIVLFGFLEEGEKEMFLILRSVSGVGPKLALSVLSGLRVPDLCQAIVDRDIKRLVALPGIGKKTAERVCVDLQEKVAHLAVSTAAPGGGMAVASPMGSTAADALSALINLGYPDPMAQQALSAVRKRLGEDSFGALQVAELIRECLRTLA
ncbi:MAG: Holliday junction branch migration protein RuvA [Desulfobulbaceae bacterium]|uniref:Holliday junction branch migration complex subunit RuvA n=1 Tax=Candidatus Desulfatifera sulfidica TaxID=2841691 RepID=A0A8J6N9G8_9BACT|nr:Holliday junction branch migration protein RuvA [Candidatus Desulfatifera sulfidica]